MNFFQIKSDLFELLTELINSSDHYQPELLKPLTIDELFFIPENPDHGFLSTNVALKLQAVQKKDSQLNPRAHAEKIVVQLSDSLKKHPALHSYIKNISVAGPGFINFEATNQLFLDGINDAVKQPADWGRTKSLNGSTVLVEFTDPNPFKEFHIGHLMSNTIGESLSRLHAFVGADVKRLCYQGDVGMHVAKTLWAWQEEIAKGTSTIESISQQPLAEKVKKLGQWYSIGSKAYEGDDVKVKEEIKHFNKLVFSREDEKTNQIYDLGRQWSLEAFEEIYKVLGTKFDKYYFESQTAKVGEKLVRENVGNVFEESQGAIIYAGEKKGLHSRVFINSQGLPTYEAKDLGLAFMKNNDFTFDSSIIITGNEVNDYFKVMLSALKDLAPEIAAKVTHLGHGMLRLPEGKMSSRTGNVITGSGLIELVKEQLLEISKDQTDETAARLTVSAIKFSLLKQSIGKDVIFDIKDSVSIHGATGVYLEYTHARACSLLANSKLDPANLTIDSAELSSQLQVLLRELFMFPFIIDQAAKLKSPSIVATYLIKVAQMYNSFYSENRIVGTDMESAGVFVSQIVKATLNNGLFVLGISSVEKM